MAFLLFVVETQPPLKKPKNFSCRPVLIHVNGASEALVDQQYFSNIIDFSALADES